MNMQNKGLHQTQHDMTVTSRQGLPFASVLLYTNTSPRERILISKFKFYNLRFPIEIFIWIRRDSRLCNMSKHDIGNEFHYLFLCMHPHILI
jgi:hypothetical protein